MLVAMRVLVTGGTGFVGSHAVVALLRAGHDVRLLVRRPDRVHVTFGPHGISVDDVVTGDVLDAVAVAEAVQGCHAVVHAAAIFSFDVRRAEAMATTNARATRVVLDAAVAWGCDPVVHVSSTVALTRREGSGPDLPLGDLPFPYSRSKIESEVHARRLQASGHPVVIVHPGAVHGPLDPYTGEQARRLAWVVRGRFPLWASGGMQVVDVRDVAAVLAAVMEPGHGPRRYVVPGLHADGAAYYSAVERAIGRRRPHLDIPAALLPVALGPVAALNRVLPDRWRYPADREAGAVIACDTRVDDTPARTELGVVPRPWQETVDDMVEWMVDAGHLPDRYRPVPT